MHRQNQILFYMHSILIKRDIKSDREAANTIGYLKAIIMIFDWFIQV